MHELLLILALITAVLSYAGTFKRPELSAVLSYIAILLAYWCEYCYVTERMLLVYFIVTILIVLSNIFLPKLICKRASIDRNAEKGALIASNVSLLLMLLSLFYDTFSLEVFNIIAKKYFLVVHMAVLILIGSAIYFSLSYKNDRKRYLISVLGASLSYFLGRGAQFVYAFYVTFYIALDVIIYFR